MLLGIFLMVLGAIGVIGGYWIAAVFPGTLGVLLCCVSGRKPQESPQAPPKPHGTAEATLVFTPCGPGARVGSLGGGCFRSSTKLRWVNPSNPQFFRTPEPTEKEYLAGLPFVAGGKTYISFSQLCCPQSDGSTRDIYGRRTLCFRERFPCFDSYDYLYENRYYRWAFLCSDGKLTRVFQADQGRKLHVTEDAAQLEVDFWKDFKRAGLVADSPENEKDCK